MSASYELMVDAAIESLRAHVLPGITGDFARGQLFSVIFALNGLKLAGDWKLAPLAEQIVNQDAAFAQVRKLFDAGECPTLPKLPRMPLTLTDAGTLEDIRNDGDRLIGQLLAWASDAGVNHANSAEMIRLLRGTIRDQLKIDLAATPKSMLHAIATGQE